jgi:Secretion system C-terminal sorting domain
MKKIFTLMAVLLLSLAASAQYSNLKSAEALKLRMDSLESNYWDSYQEQWDSSMYYYDYNASGQMILYYNTWVDNSSGEVLGEGRYEYSYNADGSMAEALVLEWDEDAADWENDDLDVYTYDEDGNQTGSVGYRWNETSELWTRKDSIFNVYNDEGLLSEYSGYEWKTDRWVIRYYSSYAYETHGWLSEQISRMWYEDLQEWKNNSKYVYTWNAAGLMLTKVRYDQEVYEGPWLEESKVEKIYGDENLLLTTNSVLWETDHWVISRTDTMEYNASGWLMEDRAYYLDEGNMRPNSIYTYSYDASGNVTEYNYSSWDRNESQLVVYGKDLFTYDPDYSMTEVVLPDEDSEWNDNLLMDQFSNIPRTIHMLHWKNDDWVDYKKGTFFYSEKNVEGVGVVEQERALVRIYPNPVSDLLHMDLHEGSSAVTLTLYEISGRQVFRRRVETCESLSLTTLPAGVYLYSLSVDGKIQSGKLLKR